MNSSVRSHTDIDCGACLRRRRRSRRPRSGEPTREMTHDPADLMTALSRPAVWGIATATVVKGSAPCKHMRRGSRMRHCPGPLPQAAPDSSTSFVHRSACPLGVVHGHLEGMSLKKEGGVGSADFPATCRFKTNGGVHSLLNGPSREEFRVGLGSLTLTTCPPHCFRSENLWGGVM